MGGVDWFGPVAGAVVLVVGMVGVGEVLFDEEEATTRFEDPDHLCRGELIVVEVVGRVDGEGGIDRTRRNGEVLGRPVSDVDEPSGRLPKAAQA